MQAVSSQDIGLFVEEDFFEGVFFFYLAQMLLSVFTTYLADFFSSFETSEKNFTHWCFSFNLLPSLLKVTLSSKLAKSWSGTSQCWCSSFVPT